MRSKKKIIASIAIAAMVMTAGSFVLESNMSKVQAAPTKSYTKESKAKVSNAVLKSIRCGGQFIAKAPAKTETVTPAATTEEQVINCWVDTDGDGYCDNMNSGSCNNPGSGNGMGTGGGSGGGGNWVDNDGDGVCDNVGTGGGNGSGGGTGGGGGRGNGGGGGRGGRW